MGCDQIAVGIVAKELLRPEDKHAFNAPAKRAAYAAPRSRSSSDATRAE